MTSNIKDLPLVSVIIPVYNAQDYLKVCINSVQQQSYSNMEIICINDGSTDCSENIIRRLMLDDDRIKLINIENHGQGYARNLGLNICVGKYVLFLDSDDFIEKRTLEITVNRAEKDDSDFVVFDWKYYDLSSIRYINMDTFFAKHLLSNNECRKLFEISPVFVLFSKNVSALINFGIILLIYFAFVWLDGIAFSWKFLCLIYPIICLIFINLGIGLILSALFIFFRDVQYLYRLFTQIVMYGSAIFYSIESMPANIQKVFYCNPIFCVIDYFRSIVLKNTIPELWHHGILAGYAVILFGVGCYVYKKYNYKFLYYI